MSLKNSPWKGLKGNCILCRRKDVVLFNDDDKCSECSLKIAVKEASKNKRSALKQKIIFWK